MASRRGDSKKETVGPQPEAPEAPVAEAYSDPVDPVIEHEEIARLAYSYWKARGFSDGSTEEDWYRAEEALKRRAAADLLRQGVQIAR